MTDVIDLADLSHCPDAAKWAAAYKQTFPDADEGLMLGWFANAMMAMHDWKEQQIAPHFAALATIPDPQAFMEAVRGMREALEQIKKRADELRAGTDDWFELVEFGLCAGDALATFDATLGEQ